MTPAKPGLFLFYLIIGSKYYSLWGQGTSESSQQMFIMNNNVCVCAGTYIGSKKIFSTAIFNNFYSWSQW